MLQFGYVSMCACVGVCVIVDGVEHTHTVVSGFCYSRCAVRKEMNERKNAAEREGERERDAHVAYARIYMYIVLCICIRSKGHERVEGIRVYLYTFVLSYDVIYPTSLLGPTV